MGKASRRANKHVTPPEVWRFLPASRPRHSLGKSLVSDWFGEAETEPVATYNLLYNASLLVESGAGYAVSLEGLINTQGGDLRFVPLRPELQSRLDIAWKKYQIFSPAAEVFLNELKKLL